MCFREKLEGNTVFFFCRIHEGMAYFVIFQIENKETCRALVYLMNFLVKFPSGDISYFYSVTSDIHNNYYKYSGRVPLFTVLKTALHAYMVMQ